MWVQVSTLRNFISSLFCSFNFFSYPFCLQMLCQMDYPQENITLSFTDFIIHFLCWTPIYNICVYLLLLIFFCWPFISMYLLRSHFITQTVNQIAVPGSVWSEAAQFSWIVLCQWVTGRSLEDPYEKLEKFSSFSFVKSSSCNVIILF